MCRKEAGLLCLSVVVWGGARAEFQGWEVKYEFGGTVIAVSIWEKRALWRLPRRERDTFQNGEQVGTAGPAVRRQGNHRQREMRLVRPGLGSSALGKALSQAGMRDHQ